MCRPRRRFRPRGPHDRALPSPLSDVPAHAPASAVRRPWSPEALLGPAAERIERPSDDELAELRPVLVHDMETEYDGRFLMAHVRGLPIDLTPPARAAFAEWAADEERHHRGFRAALERLFGDGVEPEIAGLVRRVPDFEPLAELFEDEFLILLLGAYDELCTVRAYRANLPLYDRLGAAFGRFLRRVIADEARHYALFLGALRERHSHRRGEAADAITRVRALEGTPYAQTFFLDHDDGDLFDDAVCDDAARVLRRHLVEREVVRA